MILNQIQMFTARLSYVKLSFWLANENLLYIILYKQEHRKIQWQNKSLVNIYVKIDTIIFSIFLFHIDYA